MRREFTDALGRQVAFDWPPRRVVSLVASQTETLVLLGLGDRLIGRTRFCVEPKGRVESVPVVGGEKSPYVDRVIEMRPDLVIANKEENRKPDVERMESAGLPVYVTFPRTAAEGVQMIRKLGALTGLEAAADELAAPCDAELRRTIPPSPRKPALVFIWKKPWMTVSRDTFTHDMLERCGARNVAADLDRGRYPKVQLEEVMALGPELVLLPDEPYAFGPSDLGDFSPYRDAAVAAGAAPPRLALLDGRIVTWYGPRIADSLRRLREIIAAPPAGA